MRNKTTQKQIAFYKLYKDHKIDPERYVPVWEFVGEYHLDEFGKWELMSYTCPHRVFELFSENPNLVERKMLDGKSGAHYYGYRLNIVPSVEYIKDETILSFYKLLKLKIEQNARLSQTLGNVK